jgi:hypothetical protein
MHDSGLRSNDGDHEKWVKYQVKVGAPPETRTPALVD